MQTITVIPPLPARPASGHKGTFGTVIVVGGCATMVGAPALCAGAAFRAGAGLVKVAVPREVVAAVLTIEPSATGVVREGDWVEALEAIDPDGRAVLAVGPGLGRDAEAAASVKALLAGRRRVVLDADGLNLLAEAGGKREGECELICTPHPGEYRRLAAAVGIEATSRDEQAALLAAAHRAVVLLKGQNTVVSDGEKVYRNTTGNPALATAGSGDVLTGLIAALWAQGMSGFEAATLGSYLHGLAADLWATEHGVTAGLKARELADWLLRAQAAVK